MKKTLITLCLSSLAWVGFSQTDSTSKAQLISGGYGEVHYNKNISSDTRYNSILDVHRIVLFNEYAYSPKTSFISEIEFEHVSEVFVEQAYIKQNINQYIDFKAGLLLIPMGITNEYHEPPTFNGVERPLVDNVVCPTTWREIGAGFSGNFIPASIKYQIYAVNGFASYNGEALLSGKSPYRSGRQKGAESFMSSPNVSAKVQYYGIPNFNIAASVYSGKTQSTLYNNIDKSNTALLESADSSVIGINMIGLDARYSHKGIQAKAVFIYAQNSNTQQYNEFAGKDVANAVMGYYAEAGYNVFTNNSSCKSELIPFARYEGYNTHLEVNQDITKNTAYNVTAITCGVTYKPTKQTVIKTDMLFKKSEKDDTFAKTLNFGVGFIF